MSERAVAGRWAVRREAHGLRLCHFAVYQRKGGLEMACRIVLPLQDKARGPLTLAADPLPDVRCQRCQKRLERSEEG